MTGLAALVAHSFRRHRTLVLVAGALLFVFEVLFVVLAGTLQASNTFGQIAALVPPVFRQVLGPSFLSMLSFSGVVGFGYFHPVILAGVVGVAIAIATEPAGEIERRFMDLVLARPVARAHLVTRSVALVIGATAVLVALMLAGTRAGLAWTASAGAAPATWRLATSLAADLAALVFCWGGIALAVAVLSRRRGTAGGVAGGLAFTTFLVDYIARVWAPGRRVSWLTPFHYYDPMSMLAGGALPPADVATLAGVGAVAIVVAYVAFGRRDL